MCILHSIYLPRDLFSSSKHKQGCVYHFLLDVKLLPIGGHADKVNMRVHTNYANL